MLKAYKYRIYPNHEQKIQMAKTFGCCRFVYNQTLAYRKDAYEKEGKSVSRTDCNNYCNRELKKEYAGYPKFKSKHDNHKSYTTNFTNGNIAVDFEKGKIKLPKLRTVKAKLHRQFVGEIKSATISQVPSSKYFVSLLVEEEQKELLKTEKSVGIDLGIKDLVITSDGEKIDHLKWRKKYEDKFAKEQRKLAHKKKGSKNREKQRRNVAKIHEKIANARKDGLHRISHKRINENQVIVSEDLSVSNMVKHPNLAKAIFDCGWSELTRQLQYKAEWYGKVYRKIGRFVPSS